MISKFFLQCYSIECHLFRSLNQYFDVKVLNHFFRIITHFGSAIFTIGIVLILMLSTTRSLRYTGIACALSLAISHAPVALVKKYVPRQRPYLLIEHAKYPVNALKDHSFPSGHTTAIFSIIIPFILLEPTSIAFLFPLACLVGISRIFLGLHYPSDVLAGFVLGSLVGCSSFLSIKSLFPDMFM